MPLKRSSLPPKPTSPTRSPRMRHLRSGSEYPRLPPRRPHLPLERQPGPRKPQSALPLKAKRKPKIPKKGTRRTIVMRNRRVRQRRTKRSRPRRPSLRPSVGSQLLRPSHTMRATRLWMSTRSQYHERRALKRKVRHITVTFTKHNL